jgi:hypothetical protein
LLKPVVIISKETFSYASFFMLEKAKILFLEGLCVGKRDMIDQQ